MIERTVNLVFLSLAIFGLVVNAVGAIFFVASAIDLIIQG
jgi:hypothetical protein